MWQLALDAWAFKGDSDAQSRLPRHVVRVVRRVEIELEGMRVPVLGRGELLANKKALARPQDLADVQALEREPKR
jgi:5,10-methylene-tetrahydrofolate dehydrogenase/methenyl tetrahydrofolate cyclohydrolase